MDDKKDVHHVSPNIDVVKHHKDSLPSWNELKYFARKYYLFLLVIALIPVALFSLGQQLANSSSAAPRLKLGTGARVGVQLIACENRESDKCSWSSNYYCQLYGSGPLQGKRTGYKCTCTDVGFVDDTQSGCYNQYFDWNCSQADEKLCPPEPTLAPNKECINGDQMIYHCGSISNNYSDTTCTDVCNNGKWEHKNPPITCPDVPAAQSLCGNVNNPPPSPTGGFAGGIPPTQPPATTPVPQGGGRVGCSCLNKPGAACTNSDGKDASRIGNSECPPDGAEGQACCRAY